MTLTADYVTNQPLTFKRMRQLLEEQGGGLQEGVTGRSATNEFKVSQRSAGGANMSVDVQPGGGWIEIDTGALNGFSHVQSDAVANVVIPPAHATLPRVDQIVLQYNDTAIPAGVGGDVPTLRVLQGTATAGAQSTSPTAANYRLGAAAMPNDCVRLADVQVDAAVATIVDAKILDRRPWARGARWSFNRTAGNFVGSAGFAAIDASMAPRIECGGGEIQVTAGVTYQADATARVLSIRLLMDSTVVLQHDSTVPASGFGTAFLNDAVTPPAGSHTFAFQFNTGIAAGTIFAIATQPATASLTETVRANASNT